MKIIHIASFKGNIGDRINHEGFYSSLKKYLKKIEIEQIELRNFYFSAENRLLFDSSFFKHINEYDLCVFGGGGFFDCHWEKSNTGTSLDLPDEFINGLKIPVLVNAMGYHEFGDSNKVCYDKFKIFLDNITNRPNWLISLRNDGSMERLNYRYNYEFANRILKVPDNGFVRFSSREVDKNVGDKKLPTLGLCITNELFCKEYNREINEEMFNKDISEFIRTIDDKVDQFILFPHTPQDIQTINTILNNIPSHIKRNKLMIAPYDAFTKNSTNRLKDYYLMCDYIVGMRFHSVITAVTLNIPTIILASHEQIEALGKELNLTDWFIRLDHENIAQDLVRLFDKLKDNESKVIESYKSSLCKIKESHEKYMERIKELIRK